MIHLKIDPGSGLPIYLQIMEEIKLLVAGEALKSGDQLPSVRNLAIELRVNPNTVAKAYTELEREGIIETRRGEGTFVASSGGKIQEKSRLDILEQKAEVLVRTALAFRLPKEKLLEIVRKSYDRIKSGKEVE
ncbi:MAG: GntR family transcriptional regulator [bacterium]